MVDDTDNKKELGMRRTEPLMRLSGTQRYAEFHRYNSVLQTLKPSKLPVRMIFQIFYDRQTKPIALPRLRICHVG